MRIAIVGCGQLARMLALAGLPLGIKFSFLADGGKTVTTDCVDGLGLIIFEPDYSDAKQLYHALGEPDVVTVEKEQVSVELLKSLAPYCDIHPAIPAIAAMQNRHNERRLLRQLNIPVAPFSYAPSTADAIHLAEDRNRPAVIKSITAGYDGKQQWQITNAESVSVFRQQAPEGAWIIENWIAFEREVSLIAVRTISGKTAFYPLTENTHKDGILISSIAPATGVDDKQLSDLHAHMARLLDTLNYVGVLTMECFVVQGSLIVNELAPRVHNSGHWTQIGCTACQFENHVRAISGLTLGTTQQHAASGMVNLLGVQKPPVDSLSEYSSLHWYDKSIRPGRKQGHVNFLGASKPEVQGYMEQLQKAL